ncbi:retrovirus-related Pol polyprotein from transposon TNT 1-94 [Trichonephila clavipes]|nr:retrovirus-related Pol polyprotein from transposon TNT 1-94 [Trichonephila clavipes]
MMGYAQRTKGYRIWLIDENKLVETINVRFDESRRGINFRQKVNSNLGYNLNLPDYYDDEDDSDRVKDSLTSRLVSKTSTETPSTSEKPDVSSDNHSLIPCTEVKWIRNIGRKVTGSNVYYSIEGEATRLKSFNEIERYCKRHNIKYDPSLFNFRKDNTESQGFSDLSEQQEALMVEVTISNCYKQAIRSRDASKWRDAMDKEINVMKERKVWDLVDHPDNIKILENRWVYTIKYDENNKIVRYKARLVARGNTQLRGESFDEVFQEYKLELSEVKSLKLRCYSDSDFATNRDDRVSMGGFITFVDETPISSRTFKQKSVSLSTMEAEYVSLTEAAKEFIWLKNVIDNKSLNLELSENVMFCDNQAAISFSKSPVENCRTKHIDVRYHFLRNLIYDKNMDNNLTYYEIPTQLACAYLKGHLSGRALDWFVVLGYRVVEDKATDYAHLKQALSEQFPVVRNRSELETRFYSPSQKHNQKLSDFVYDLLKIHKILKLEMTEEKLIYHISRLEPQILDYVEVINPQIISNLLQIIDKYEERFLNRQIRGSSWESRDIQPNENNRFPNTGIDKKIGGKREVAIDMLTIVDHGESSIDLRVKVLWIIRDSMVDAEVVSQIIDSTIKAVDRVVQGIVLSGVRMIETDI